MPAVTYLNQNDAIKWRTVPDDKDCDELLQQVRATTGEDWIIEVFTHHSKPKLFRKSQPYKFYTLYFGLPGGVEYQIVNLVSPKGGTIFYPTEISRELIMNFLMGLRNGYEECATKTERTKVSSDPRNPTE